MIGDMIERITASWFLLGITIYLCYLTASTLYNLVLSPLSKYPGPLLSKISGIPSWYHAIKGDRHIWIYKCHQKYGKIIRYSPNGLLFDSGTAYRDIHGPKVNVYKNDVYKLYPRNSNHPNTLHSFDRNAHARKRRILNTAFSERSVRFAEEFIVKHVDRWIELLLLRSDGWTDSKNMSDQSDYLFFDIMADLSFGKSFDIKEHGKNEIRSIPNMIHAYLNIINWVAKSPFVPLWVYLKPRGLDSLLEIINPAPIKQYFSFIEAQIVKRLELEAQQEKLEEKEQRKDMFHYIIQARDPESGRPYTPEEVHTEAHLLIVAGSDTSAVVLSGMFYYLTKYRDVYDKLQAEVRGTFNSTEDIVSGKKLGGCKYLKAVIDETLRMCPPVPADLERKTLTGGATIDGVYVPENVAVSTGTWALHYNANYHPDPFNFRPERWIVGEGGTTAEDVAREAMGWYPFSWGPGNCVGQKLAVVELSVILGRVIWSMDFERVNKGDEWKGSEVEREGGIFPYRDHFIGDREGPNVRFRRRVL